ncbi:excinuclease ABC subunit A [Pseudooceanicola sp. LIPI14-2-Ac024]|uniref:excinuclease ABC subunit A n=1 Tax=Pseudooceanicola sp. LIPI14-2-Ac024 TaxID=3344875 RepID=UPI0035CF1DA7
MRPIFLITALALAATPALAGPKNHGHGNGHVVAQNGCPPGLAKKHNGCTPPGLAKKQWHGDRDHDRDRDYSYRYRVGDRVVDVDRLVLIRDPGRYGLDPYGTYYRDNGYVIRVDRETRELMALVGLVSAILGG